jgi:3-oxoacyl-[acyl-carrier protein] reductase
MKSRALITGASRGIGAAIAVALAQKGHPVILNYRSNHAAAQELQKKIEMLGGKAELAPFDVANSEQVAQAIEKLLQDKENPIGVLVNNAGLAKDNTFPLMSIEAWQEVTRTTLDGFFHVTQPLVMPMVRRRWGRIISISSISGVMGNRGQVNYSAAKAGLIGATKSLAQELAKRNVTVNCVAPGLIETDMVRNLPQEEIIREIPMRRLGKPEEVAALVAFLASDEAAYITGQVISINGGLG